MNRIKHGFRVEPGMTALGNRNDGLGNRASVGESPISYAATSFPELIPTKSGLDLTRYELLYATVFIE